MKEWNGIGHVPFKEKDKIYKQYHSQIDKLFERFNISASNKKLSNLQIVYQHIQEGSPQALYRERDKLVRALRNMKNECRLTKTIWVSDGFFQERQQPSDRT